MQEGSKIGCCLPSFESMNSHYFVYRVLRNEMQGDYYRLLLFSSTFCFGIKNFFLFLLARDYHQWKYQTAVSIQQLMMLLNSL